MCIYKYTVNKWYEDYTYYIYIYNDFHKNIVGKYTPINLNTICCILYSIKQALLTLSDVRFQTITECPEFSRFLTMPEPIIPSPKKPNFKGDGRIFFSFNVWETLSTSNGGVSCIKKRKKKKKCYHLLLYTILFH